MVDIKFEIKETVGVLSESAKGWTKELNLIVGMTESQSMTSENGRQSMTRWVKV